MKYELGCYIPEDGILHSHRRENIKSCTVTVLDVRVDNLMRSFLLWNACFKSDPFREMKYRNIETTVV
jgi:hypothetical protein